MPESAITSSFHTTRWTVVFEAQGDDQRASRAREEICRTYWLPLYTYLRRSGKDHHDAQDLTQGFLARFLENDRVKQLHPSQGKLRTFFLRSIKNYLFNEWHKESALKRGGGIEKVSLDDPEGRFQAAATDDLSPEAAFDQTWAFALLDRARNRLREAYEAEDRNAHYEALEPYLTMNHQHHPYSATAEASELFDSGDAVRKAVHRFRLRFGKFLREEIERTVGSAADADEEIQALFAAYTS